MRRVALLAVPALFGLASCGIPETGVVEAGGPAGGVVPTIRVYFAADGALVAVSRRSIVMVDAESAVELLLLGPTDAERAKGLTTGLRPPGMLPTLAPDPWGTPDASYGPAPEGLAAAGPVRATTGDKGISIELTAAAGELSGLAVDQLTCTVLGVQRLAAPSAEPLPVTVTGPDGRRAEGGGASCPER
ncbi:hypothetical protein [Streptomyces cyaneus]|uniref:hypothetical protein n=1 Tax=Streptomyces cyaneus TaxID=1904 RepID=UPI000FF8A83D|nr:hypothetical protein [Streptomyces cyaneus]